MPTVNKERIRMLVDALRSGKYRQGRGALALYVKKQKRYRYCCLGVACEVARANGLDLSNTTSERISHDSSMRRYKGAGSFSFDSSTTILPPSVAGWFNLPARNPMLLEGPYGTGKRVTRRIAATSANDELGLNFSQIADLFESTYLSDDDES